jgi:flagellar secretion chaperone FliS
LIGAAKVYRNPSIAKGPNQYRLLELSSKLESADQHSLVAILYEELLRSLDVLAAALRHGRNLSCEHHVVRAKSILIALSTSLDFEQGQLIAATLDGVYRAMMKQLDQVVFNQAEEKLSELRSGVLNVSDAWNAIIPQRI